MGLAANLWSEQSGVAASIVQQLLTLHPTTGELKWPLVQTCRQLLVADWALDSNWLVQKSSPTHEKSFSLPHWPVKRSLLITYAEGSKSAVLKVSDFQGPINFPYTSWCTTPYTVSTHTSIYTQNAYHLHQINTIHTHHMHIHTIYHIYHKHSTTHMQTTYIFTRHTLHSYTQETYTQNTYTTYTGNICHIHIQHTNNTRSYYTVFFSCWVCLVSVVQQENHDACPVGGLSVGRLVSAKVWGCFLCIFTVLTAWYTLSYLILAKLLE